MKTVAITGANRGIGLALTQEYLSCGYQVIAICRSASLELQQTDAKIVDGIDVTSADALQKLKSHVAKMLGGNSIDILINNAGILRNESLDCVTAPTMEEQLEVNALAPLRLTETLLPFIDDHGKLAFITSRMGSIEDNGSGGYYGYRMSKAALNAGAKSLAMDLRSRGTIVAIIHPGFVQTDMVSHQGDIDAATCARRIKCRLDDWHLSETGFFKHSNGEQLPW